jgi:hypothetical protein
VFGRGGIAVDQPRPLPPHEAIGSFGPALEIERAEQCLDHVAQHIVAVAGAVLHRLLAQLHLRGEADRARDFRTRLARHQHVEPARQPPLRLVGKGRVQPGRHSQSQHAVAQKLEPLIIRAVAAGMRHGPLEHGQIARTVSGLGLHPISKRGHG